jgi:hypothetical protein
VKRLSRIVGLVLLVLWVPITSHCMLENIRGMEFLKCATDTDQGKNCEDDSCTQLESATYRISDTHTDFLSLAFFDFSAVVFLEFPVDEQPTAVIETPPEIPVAWQFFFRTALPPRAPSFVS